MRVLDPYMGGVDEGEVKKCWDALPSRISVFPENAHISPSNLAVAEHH